MISHLLRKVPGNSFKLRSIVSAKLAIEQSDSRLSLRANKLGFDPSQTVSDEVGCHARALRMGEAELDRLIERATVTDRQQFLRVVISERERHA
jgi:hypothetical protein